MLENTGFSVWPKSIKEPEENKIKKANVCVVSNQCQLSHLVIVCQKKSNGTRRTP
jgi:hypothetical protein